MLATIFLLTQPWMLLSVLAAGAYCWFMFSLLSTCTPEAFSAELLLSQSVSSLRCLKGLLLLGDRTLHLSLLNFTRLVLVHFSSLVIGDRMLD